MGKLKKREIVILIIAGLFVLYGAYTYWAAGVGKKHVGTTSATQAGQIAARLAQEFAQDKLSESEERVIDVVAKDWVKSPFLDKESYRVWTLKSGSPAGQDGVKIVYSGYVDSGKHKFAILNGLEYMEGEKLEIEGYVLTKITPSRVVILNKNTGSSLEVPLQE